MRVDFTSQEVFRNPAAGIERLRAHGPVVETRFPIVGKVWVTTTYDATARVLKDSTAFTLRKEGSPAGLRWWMRSFVGAMASNMLTVDEPDHTRLREIVDEAFRRRAVLDMQPHIRAIADNLADELFADGSPADLSSAMPEYCRSRSSASCSACPRPTGRNSSPGRTQWR